MVSSCVRDRAEPSISAVDSAVMERRWSWRWCVEALICRLLIEHPCSVYILKTYKDSQRIGP